ncbi:unnamed protein product [Vitrella brassicaformis CCMP3155]|uniref:HECT-type E3 ubiquitin transferase n=2 Tax=Vitrella brassicaformis TaxID=1169539 RepID=A0A0G4GIH5_VITBC|nr:unnamed protein product [Vitrella brassicaformis CCMP3155]|eukprot:CEM29655.1 unnamed protein product [Vitrella brassicaformis CCMP3155]
MYGGTFDGSSKGRVVSLAGASGRKQDKTAFLAQQRREREERERHRLREKSATAIQRVYRAFRDLEQHRSDERALFDKRVADVQRVRAALPQDVSAKAVATVLPLLLRHIQFFMRVTRADQADRERLTRVVEWVRESGQQQPGNGNFFASGRSTDRQIVAVYTVQTKRLLTALLALHFPPDCILNVLDCFVSSGQPKGGSVGGLLDAKLPAHVSAVVAHLVQRCGLFGFLADCVGGWLREGERRGDVMMAANMGVVATAAVDEQDVPYRSEGFFVLLFAIPYFVPRTLQTSHDVLQLIRNPPGRLVDRLWQRPTSQGTTIDGTVTDGQPAAMWTLGNLLSFLQQVHNEGGELPPLYLRLLSWSHEKVPPLHLKKALRRYHHLRRASKQAETVDADMPPAAAAAAAAAAEGGWRREDVVMRDVSVSVSGGTGPFDEPPDRLCCQVGILLERFLLRSLLAMVEGDPHQQIAYLLQLYFPPPPMPVPTSPPLRGVTAGSHMSHHSVDEDMEEEQEIGSNVAAIDPAVLNTLAFATGLTAKLYSLIRQEVTRIMQASKCSFTTMVDSFLSQLGSPPVFLSPLATILRAFCAVYLHQLQVMYDHEFRGDGHGPSDGHAGHDAGATNSQRNPLSIPEVRWITPFLNLLAFRLVKTSITNAPQAGAPPKWSLRQLLTGLVRSLYDRDARVHFMKDGDWVVGEARSLLRNRYQLIQGLNAQSPFDDWEAGSQVGGGVANTAIPHANDILDAVLLEIPHTVPFNDRVLVFRHNTAEDRRERTRNPFGGPQHVHQIRRDYIVEDGLTSLGSLDEAGLKDVFRVQFVDSDGMVEAGIDGGGLFKEFLISLSRTAFNPNYGLFQASPNDQSLYPSPAAFVAHPNAAQLFTLLGKVVGKALYEHILIEPQFNRVFLNLLLGRLNQVDDIPSLDPEFHKNLLYLKQYSGNVEELSLTFAASVGELGSTEEHDLIPNGHNIPVTNETKFKYIHLISHFKTNVQIKTPTDAFLQGLQAVLPLEWLRMFSQDELRLLISGTPEGFDVLDLRRHTRLAGGYEEGDETIKLFWEALKEMDKNERAAFLMFVTSCSRAPLLGFQNLTPPFSIHRVNDTTRLPTASTCANLLKLPDYRNKATIMKKLRQSIFSGQGFQLS